MSEQTKNLGEKFDMPNGESLFYVDKDHSYWRCKEDGGRGKRLTGVTTISKVFDVQVDRLLTWAARTQCIGIAEAFKNGVSTGWLDSAESIWKHLEDEHLTFEDVRLKAAKRGTNVHELAFEALGLGEPIPRLDQMTEEEQGHAQGVMGFWLDHSPTPEQVEQVVYSSELGVAGQLDFRGKLRRCENEACGCLKVGVEQDDPGIVDCKTGRWIGGSDHLQVGGGYPLLSEECGFGPCAWALILHTREDGTYELLPAHATPADFRNAVEVYRTVGAINRKAKADREALE